MALGFSTQVDIANRACQHCGVDRIADFNEDSVQASEISFNYDKLRRAELRRNVWVFSIKRAALRPVLQGQTMLLNPVLWSSTTTYGLGAIVADTAGYLWQSMAQDNLNNVPDSSEDWDSYCGPMTVNLFDNTGQTGYYAGELVYESPGDGTYNVFMSLTTGNNQDPRAPTLWVSTTQYMRDQVVRFYAQWASGTTYAAGNTVAYTDGNAYVAITSGNVGNTPSTSTANWAVVPATLAPPYYNAASTYSVGNFVTYLGVNYASRVNSNVGNTPSSSPTQWAAQTTGTFYASLIDFNLNIDPSQVPLPWSNSTTYSAAQTVSGSDGFIYSSIGNGNVGHDPTQTSGFWTNTNVLAGWTTTNPFGIGAQPWVQIINAKLNGLITPYPVQSSTPSAQSFSRNYYRLPSNFMRRAPQDPKQGSVSFLGAPSAMMYDDWVLEGKFLVTRDSNPIVLRFAADIVRVTEMDDLFCEGLGARIGFEIVERLSQSDAKKASIGTAYNKFMGEARAVNGIEASPTEAPEDDYISTRI